MSIIWTIDIDIKDLNSQRISITGTRNEDGSVSTHRVLDTFLPDGNKATKQAYMEGILQQVYLADKSKTDAIIALKLIIEADIASNMVTWEGTL